MKILVAGSNTSGSWQIRGEQLGKAIGADVSIKPKSVDGYDCVVLVKRPDAGWLNAIHTAKLVVWDVVDSWPQPSGNSFDRDAAMNWLSTRIREIRPNAIVAATGAMADDCAQFDIPVICIPHHARSGQELNPIRDRVHVVGYEGGERYLGAWREILERQCAIRGWRFVVNPETLADLDIVVALRDVQGYPVRNWKSNVKLANAQATGTPCILSPEKGYIETQSGAECWAENEQSLIHSLDLLTEYKVRAETSRILRTATPYLSSIAEKYKAWLQQLKF